MKNFALVKQALRQQKLDGWLFYDFRRSNNLACEFLEIPPQTFLTRRFFYWLPSDGEPIILVHAVEKHVLDHLPGKKITYSSWQELHTRLRDLLQKSKTIAMEYSPNNAIPYVSKVDAGTLELVRQQGVEVVTSADLLQQFNCVWTATQLRSHLAAAQLLDNTAAKTWQFIRTSLNSQRPLSEYDVQQFILNEIHANSCIMDGLPICAVNAHAADPHYSPQPTGSWEITEGDLVLIDLWCKQKAPASVYADITRMGIVGKPPTDKQKEIFNIVREAQRQATRYVQENFSKGIPIAGYQVDDVARRVIADAGYDNYFIHRTGHSIGERDHGDGANIDNLETQDKRRLIPGTCFSIEPGIYLPGEFGVRLEYDIFINFDSTIMITGGSQENFATI